MNYNNSLVLFFVVLNSWATADEPDFNMERQWQEIHSFNEAQLQGSQLVVDNIIGGIEVLGYDGSDIEIVVKGQWRGLNEEDLSQAEEELELIVEKTSYGLLVFLETPYRDNSRSYQKRSRNYRFNYDIKIRVPENFILDLSTVTGGDLKLSGIQSELHLENVNGDIVIEDSTIAGRIETVSGDIYLYYSSEPNLMIDFHSRYGDLLSDFEYELVANASTVVVEKIGQLTSYKRSPFLNIKLGDGESELTLESLSGDIAIEKAKTL